MTSIDWYVAKTTCSPSVALFAFRESARRWPSVVAGIGRSTADSSAVSLRADEDTFVSEHTAHAVNAPSASAAQSSSVCLRSASEGTANRIRAVPPSFSTNSRAIVSAVNVLPVPHAMTIVPRSCSSKPAITALRART